LKILGGLFLEVNSPENIFFEDMIIIISGWAFFATGENAKPMSKRFVTNKQKMFHFVVSHLCIFDIKYLRSWRKFQKSGW